MFREKNFYFFKQDGSIYHYQVERVLRQVPSLFQDIFQSDNVTQIFQKKWCTLEIHKQRWFWQKAHVSHHNRKPKILQKRYEASYSERCFICNDVIQLLWHYFGTVRIGRQSAEKNITNTNSFPDFLLIIILSSCSDVILV